MIRTAAIWVICTAHLALAQDIAGSWIAQSTGGRFDRLSLQFTRDRQDRLSGNMLLVGHISTDTVGFTCSSISVNDSKVSFALESQKGSGTFNGTVTGDNKSMSGILEYAGSRARITFERSGRVPAPRVSPTTAGAAPASTVDSSELLSRALAKLAGIKGQLLKYTCLETIERRYFSPPAAAAGTALMNEIPQACSGRVLGNNGRLHLKAEDRLRIEAAVSGDGKEIDSWVSASSFDSRSIHDLVPTGATITGIFGGSLVDIFENPGAHYAFQGQRTEGGRVLFSYSFEVPLQASGYQVRAGNGWKTTASRGAFDIDASTGELVHVVSQTIDPPPDAEACISRTSTDYHYQPIGGGQYLIPLKSDFDVLLPDGNEDHSVMVFSGCHEYAAQSSLSFGAAGAPLSGSQVAPRSAAPIPAGLSLTLALASAIDTRTAAGGDGIAAKVSKAVRAPGSGQTVVEAGAIAHGRILEVRQDFDTGEFLICMHFDTLEQNGAVSPLAVRLDAELKAEQAKSKTQLSTRGTEFSLPKPSAEPGTWFTLGARDGHAIMAAGLETKWITVSQ